MKTVHLFHENIEHTGHPADELPSSLNAEPTYNMIFCACSAENDPASAEAFLLHALLHTG